ncbi:hypothetical protein M8C21_019815, partial [Ambrosia artemisiifolia]
TGSGIISASGGDGFGGGGGGRISADVVIVYGALRMTVKMFLMWKSQLLIDVEGDKNVQNSFLEASNLIVLKESSTIRSNANLGVHGQGLLNLSGPGDHIEAQRLVLSLFYGVNVGPGSVLRGPLENMTANAVVPKLNCESQQCPNELLNPPDDCNVNASLPFTLQICRVEDILVQGCIGGIGKGEVLSVGVGSGGGYGGSGGYGCYNGTCIDGGLPYGNADLPCWLGSGGGTDDITDPTAAGGGVLVIGSLDHPVSSLSVDGSLGADGGSHTIVEQDDWFQGSGDGGGGGGLREFVRSEYDHACLRSCRSRALYEGLKVAATSDLMLAYVDFFLGGDEKRSDLPPPLHQRFPLSLLFGGDGSYMAPFSLHSDNVITTLINQSVPPTTWYRFVAGLNAQLRLVRRGRLRVMFSAAVTWIETYANPTLKIYGIRVDLALFQATSGNNHQYGIVVTSVRVDPREQLPSNNDNAFQEDSREDKSLYQGQGDTNENLIQKKSYDGRVLDIDSVKSLKENRQIVSYALSFIIHNTKPVGHQDLVGLVISVLLLGDFSLVLLTLFQLYSFSLAHVFLVLFILPLGILLPFPAGINALFSQGPRRSSGLARIYALWNITSLVNVVVAFFCGYAHYSSQASKTPSELQPWTMEESEWWIFPVALVLCKCIQSIFINWHIANLEIQDRSLYSSDTDMFWQSS